MMPTFLFCDCKRGQTIISETSIRAPTALPVAFAISVKSLNTPGTVKGFGLNMVG